MGEEAAAAALLLTLCLTLTVQRGYPDELLGGGTGRMDQVQIGAMEEEGVLGTQSSGLSRALSAAAQQVRLHGRSEEDAQLESGFARQRAAARATRATRTHFQLERFLDDNGRSGGSSGGGAAAGVRAGGGGVRPVFGGRDDYVDLKTNRSSICLPRVDRQTILTLTCWVCGSDSSTLEQERVRARQAQVDRDRVGRCTCVHSLVSGGSHHFPRLPLFVHPV